MMTRVVAALTLILAMDACRQEPEVCIMPEEVTSRLRDGDVVFRLGAGVNSRVITSLADPGGEYSHVGIVVLTDSCPTVIHAVPYEPEFPGDVDRVKAEPVERFFSSMLARAGSVGRSHDSIAATKAAACARRIHGRGALFDHDYDDTDSTAMYCCELVDFAYKEAGYPLIGSAERHDIKIPGRKPIRCILPSDIAHSERLSIISSFIQTK